MNRRNFFRRTVGAAILGLSAPLLPKVVRPYDPVLLERGGLAWHCNRDANRMIPILYKRLADSNPFLDCLQGGKFPKI